MSCFDPAPPPSFLEVFLSPTLTTRRDSSSLPCHCRLLNLFIPPLVRDSALCHELHGRASRTKVAGNEQR
ncbi:hypothetical protein RJ55_02335 [Drechmeria coniospora]|nr:hypothetical protein RJ55_02335 [Drechmeria coniospora]